MTSYRETSQEPKIIGGGVINGNNNRIIEAEGAVPQAHEGVEAWRHLNQAEILPEAYTGASAAGVNDVKVSGGNVPKSSYSNEVFCFFSSPTNIIFGRLVKASITHGTDMGNTCSWCEGGLLAPEAQNIDAKIDDGVANTGRLLGVDGNIPAAGSCSAKFNTAGSDYNLASTTKACRLFYLYRD